MKIARLRFERQKRVKESAMKSFEEIREASKPLAQELEEEIRAERPGKFSVPAKFFSLAGRDEDLRKAVLRFVGTLPQLRTRQELREHFRMYVGPYRNLFPWYAKLGFDALDDPQLNRFAVPAVRWLIRNQIAPYFIVKDERKLAQIRRSYQKQGAGITADILGELVLSDEQAQYFLDRYIKVMHAQGHNQDDPFRIAVKLSSLATYFEPERYERSKRLGQESLREILRHGKPTNSFVSVDMEHSQLQGLIEDIFLDTICEEEFRNTPQVGIAQQAYLVNSSAHIQRLVEVAKERGTPFMVRLVKGAYWDGERALASQRGWPPRVYLNKEETDENFDRMVYFLMQNWETVYVSPATHNPANLAFALCAAREFGILEDPNFRFQLLYGIGEPQRKVLCQKGWPVDIYAPLSGGDLVTDMSFFARRLDENTANQNFVFRLLAGRED